MQTWEDAIEYLTCKGFFAQRHRACQGNGIFAGAPAHPPDELELVERAVDIWAPNQHIAGWFLTSLSILGVYATLADAVKAAEAFILDQPLPEGIMSVKNVCERAKHREKAADEEASNRGFSISDLVDWSAPHPREGRHALRNRDELLEVWRSHGGAEEHAPSIDFDRHLLIAIFMDEGAYNESFSVKRVETREDRVLVHLGSAKRPWKMINPQSVFPIPRTDAPVEFVLAP